MFWQVSTGSGALLLLMLWPSHPMAMLPRIVLLPLRSAPWLADARLEPHPVETL